MKPFLMILGAALIFFDCRDRSVPTPLLLVFAGLMLGYALIEPQWSSAALGFLLVVSISGVEYLSKRPLLGEADKILFPLLLLRITPLNLPFYFILVGILGVGFAIFWQRCWQEQSFPFLPALLLPFFGLDN